MSKRIKKMLIDDIRSRLEGVNDVILVCLGQLDAQKTTELRRTLRQKNIELQLIKNSLARHATLDTPLAPAFTETSGMLAMAWGGEDVVDLAKELDRIVKLKEYDGIEFRGGALDGGRLEPDDVKAVAKWPSRAEQLSILSGQISSVGSMLSGQLLSAGGAIAGQLKTRVEELEKAEA